MKKIIPSILLFSVLVLKASANQNHPSRAISKILDLIVDNGIDSSNIYYISPVNNFTNVELITWELVKRRIEGVGPLGTNVHLKIDALLLNGEYNFQKLVIFPFHLSGQGKFSILLRHVNFKLNIYAKKGLTGEKYYAKLNYIGLKVREAKVKFTNLFGSRSLSTLFNKFLNITLPTILKVLFRKLFIGQKIEKLYGEFLIGTDKGLFMNNMDSIVDEIPNFTEIIE